MTAMLSNATIPVIHHLCIGEGQSLVCPLLQMMLRWLTHTCPLVFVPTILIPHLPRYLNQLHQLQLHFHTVSSYSFLTPKSRKPAPHAPPVIQTPSPGPKVKKKKVKRSTGRKLRASIRNLALTCPLLEHQAVEVDAAGVSQSGSVNSQVDIDLSNDSCVTDGTAVNGVTAYDCCA
jgi:hypothetical protein